MHHLNPLADPAPAITDQQVIQEIIGGHREMFDVIVRRYNPRLYRVGRRICAVTIRRFTVLLGLEMPRYPAIAHGVAFKMIEGLLLAVLVVGKFFGR